MIRFDVPSAFRGPFAAAASLLVLAGCGREAAPAPASEIELLAIDAALGDPKAKYNLAVRFYRGEGVPRDYRKAARLWKQVADEGDADATNNLGYLTYHGLGVVEDPEAAVALWREAVARGQSESSMHLGYAALEGRGTRRDSVEAYARFRAAELLADPSERSDREMLPEVRRQLAGLRIHLSSRRRARGEELARGYAAAASAADPAPR